MEVWKEVIRPGVYWYKDQKGEDRRLVVSASNVDHLNKTGSDMLAAGLSIPVPLEHPKPEDPLGAPLTDRQKSATQLLNNAGWVRKYRVHNGVLFALAQITDPKVEQKIKEGSIAWTSPKIAPKFTDGDGREWSNSVTHLALTLRPRATNQAPFNAPLPKGWDGAALMSLDGITEAVCPSVVRSVGCTNDTWQIRYPVLFGLEDILDDGKKNNSDKDSDKDGKPDSVDPPKVDDIPPIDDTTKDAETGYYLPELMSLLEEKGIHLPPDTSDENFLQHLWVAIHAVTGPDKKAAEEAAKLAGSQPPVTQEQQPMYMSLNDVAKKNDPVTLALARNVFNAATVRRQNRINAVCKRANDKALAEKLTGLAAGAELSLKADGGVHDPMETTLDLLESSIQNISAQLQARGQGTMDATLGLMEQPHPSDMGNGITEERRKKLVEDGQRAAGVRVK